MKFSYFHLYVLVFYFLADMMPQISVLYATITFVNSNIEPDFEKLWITDFNLYHPTRIYKLIEALGFALYSVQSVWISLIFIWFMRKNLEE